MDRGSNGRFVNLREYFDSKLTDIVNKIESDRQSDNQAVGVALAAVSRERIIHTEAHEREHLAHMREHALGQKAIDLAATLQQENKIDNNGWRRTMSDKDRTYATIVSLDGVEKEVQALREANIVRVQAEVDRADREQQRREDMERRVARSQWMVGTAIAALTSILFVVLRLTSVLR